MQVELLSDVNLALRIGIYALNTVHNPERTFNDAGSDLDWHRLEKVVTVSGHESVSEHIVLSFRISDISRLALEYLEHHRLASYTETSFRHMHRELEFYPVAGAEEEFKTLSALYSEGLNSGLHPEDIRNILPLAVLSSVTFTANLRELRLIVSRFTSCALQEVRHLGQELKRIVSQIFTRHLEETPNWTPWSSQITPETEFFHEVLKFDWPEDSERLSEGTLHCFTGLLTTSALAQLRRHRMGSLISTRPSEAALFSNRNIFIPASSSSVVNTKLFSAVKSLQALVVHPEMKDNIDYLSPMGGLRAFKWLVNSRDLTNFLNLRTSPTAQREIRNFAIRCREGI
jgi:thymidylate synthase ThyX